MRSVAPCDRHRQLEARIRRGVTDAIEVTKVAVVRRENSHRRLALMSLIEVVMKTRQRNRADRASEISRAHNGNRAVVRPPLGGALAARSAVPKATEIPRANDEFRAVVRTRAGSLAARTPSTAGPEAQVVNGGMGKPVVVVIPGGAPMLDRRSARR
jgi:hypothetical protein